MQLPETDVVQCLRTPTVPVVTISGTELDALKRELARASGMPRQEMERAFAEREGNQGGYELSYFEPANAPADGVEAT